MSQTDVINILKSYLIILHEAGINIDQAFLYGSYAGNQANENSDIDVLLVSGIFDTDDDIILSLPWLYASKVDHRIEPLAVGKKRFMTDDISPVLEAVRQGGIEIKV
jgi:predicted nucleotidyltransferase